MCFGSGEIETSPSPKIVKIVPKPQQKRPSRQRAPRQHDGRLETAITTISGLPGAKNAQTLISALKLLDNWAATERIEPSNLYDLRSQLANALKAEKRYAGLFITSLVAEMRKRGATMRNTLVDLQYFMRDGGVKAQLTEDAARLLVKAYNAQNPRKEAETKEATKAVAAVSSDSGLPIPDSVKAALRSASKPSKSAEVKRVEHILVTAEGPLDEGKLRDCARLIDRHKLRFIYLAGSKKALREMKNAFPGIDTMAVTNKANLALIKGLGNIAILAADKTS